MSKAAKMLTALAIAAALALFGWWFISKTIANAERAAIIEGNLIGKRFTCIISSEEHGTLLLQAKDGTEHFIECDYISTSEWNYSFEEDGTCTHTGKWTRTFPRHEKRDGINMEDLTKSETPYTYPYSVHISLSNQVTVNIGTGQCELLVDEYDVPIGLIKGDNLYE